MYLVAHVDLVPGSGVSALRLLIPSALGAGRVCTHMELAMLRVARLRATLQPVCQRACHPLTTLSE